MTALGSNSLFITIKLSLVDDSNVCKLCLHIFLLFSAILACPRTCISNLLEQLPVSQSQNVGFRTSKLRDCKLGIKLFKNSHSRRLEIAKIQNLPRAGPLDPWGIYNASKIPNRGSTTLCAVADTNVQIGWFRQALFWYLYSYAVVIQYC